MLVLRSADMPGPSALLVDLDTAERVFDPFVDEGDGPADPLRWACFAVLALASDSVRTEEPGRAMVCLMVSCGVETERSLCGVVGAEPGRILPESRCWTGLLIGVDVTTFHGEARWLSTFAGGWLATST